MWQIEEFYAYEYDFTVSIPESSRFLSARTQDGQSHVAFLLDPSKVRLTRKLHVLRKGVCSS